MNKIEVRRHRESLMKGRCHEKTPSEWAFELGCSPKLARDIAYKMGERCAATDPGEGLQMYWNEVDGIKASDHIAFEWARKPWGSCSRMKSPFDLWRERYEDLAHG